MRLKGSYTVEAAIVISFCFILFGMAVGLAYELFKLVIEYVKYTENEFDAVSMFRLKEGVEGVIHAFSN